MNRFANAMLRLARHRRMQPAWRTLHRASLIGMNYWASEFRWTGELDALRFVRSKLAGSEPAIIFDVGANVGDFSRACLEVFDDRCRIHAFEPSAATFRMLQANVVSPDVALHRMALSDRDGRATLHSSEAGSSIASLVDLDRPVRPFRPELEEEVVISTIDSFCEEHAVGHVDFLKVDVEGHELSVIKGARRMLEQRRIGVVQFEFGENNVSARTFLSDFRRLLEGFDLYRIVPGGPVPWDYVDGSSEVFATMNYLAVLREARV